MTDRLTPEDFPLVAHGQFVYRRQSSGPIIGPVDYRLAAELAERLNRDQGIHADGPGAIVQTPGAARVTMLRLKGIA